ncbi:hypothetical protein A674_04888 [Salmonella enterica subsp. enterica serovar Enteritidis str. 2009K1651]|uniref:Uncharacterized protein n=4 Tax=Salmonella enterica TaxID=28901 RepID=M7REG5_SALDU|nr:hypothetical protein IA1_10965 [Salmonella enterica subsp. enterica serovar Thompson str. RM6836]EMR51819.1 hypothetical protein A670_02930 [Salmonella enterica subsp. enterica serovar Dublin str. UC16]EPI62959.1 hypothetical protein A673_04953 [Salmonella enterica subsp. enterica serovar Enteritidis str. 2009K0958]EPI63641.1 hypothetical protein A671_05189 [Salmonella enterica subsp. enterica serovar Dublin str. DG22]EPI76954.1 hypothetical protein A674_04888 [Salmonella enterica subsp. ent
MVIIFTALFEFKNAHKCPVSRRLFCQHPAQGCVRNITGMETVTAILLMNVIQIVI